MLLGDFRFDEKFSSSYQHSLMLFQRLIKLLGVFEIIKSEGSINKKKRIPLILFKEYKKSSFNLLANMFFFCFSMQANGRVQRPCEAWTLHRVSKR